MPSTFDSRNITDAKRYVRFDLYRSARELKGEADTVVFLPGRSPAAELRLIWSVLDGTIAVAVDTDQVALKEAAEEGSDYCYQQSLSEEIVPCDFAFLDLCGILKSSTLSTISGWNMSCKKGLGLTVFAARDALAYPEWTPTRSPGGFANVSWKVAPDLAVSYRVQAIWSSVDRPLVKVWSYKTNGGNRMITTLFGERGGQQGKVEYEFVTSKTLGGLVLDLLDGTNRGDEFVMEALDLTKARLAGFKAVRTKMLKALEAGFKFECTKGPKA